MDWLWIALLVALLAGAIISSVRYGFVTTKFAFDVLRASVVLPVIVMLTFGVPDGEISPWLPAGLVLLTAVYIRHVARTGLAAAARLEGRVLTVELDRREVHLEPELIAAIEPLTWDPWSVVPEPLVTSKHLLVRLRQRRFFGPECWAIPVEHVDGFLIRLEAAGYPVDEEALA